MLIDAKDRIASLSPRQLECLRLVPRGSSKVIGQALGISHLTVDKHISAALQTLGVNSRDEAAALVLGWHDCTTQDLGTESPCLAGPAKTGSFGVAYPARSEGAGEHRLRETPAVFRVDEAFDWNGVAGPEERSRVRDASAWQIIFRIVAIAVGLAIIASAAQPIAQGYQALSNLIEPYRDI
ncbi:LuxR C-terminal-related transcriptional regulator [Sphingosinithalassobacter sp. LHW66-3]|uniref:LuxR C-terminal-related transcriptional regulator n=1 Tax=Sphingosinithalassobacter sp. LHW66-3 TaxID=3424718 RepID=UPI003D6B621D